MTANVLTLRPDTDTDCLKDRLASEVAVDLANTEGQLDQFLAHLGQGLSTMAGRRREAGLRPGFGQASLEHYVQVIAQGVAIRGAMIEAHSNFAKDARREGIDWRLLLPTESTPDDPDKETVPKG